MSSGINNGNIFFPNVTSIPGQSGQSERASRKDGAVPGEFGRALDKAISEPVAKPAGRPAGADLGQLKAPLKFSAHAMQRLSDRKIAIDQATMAKVTEAVDKADSKGVDDTLVLTRDLALIVSVKNRTVITAMDRGSMTGNVFTNIDGAVIV